ncbi:MAG: potassium channel family protein [Mycoplasmatales bacterium]
MKILITDGYKKADFLIKNLLEEKHDITIIHDNDEFAEKLLCKYDINVFVGNTSDILTYETLDTKAYDVLICLSNLDHKNFIVSKISEIILDVKKRVILVSNPNNERAFNAFGIKGTVSASHLITNIINRLVVVDDVLNYIGINNSEVRPIEIKIRSHFKAIGKAIKDLNFPSACIVCCIIRGENTIIPTGDEVILRHDKVVIFTNIHEDKKVVKVFEWEANI